MAEWLLCFHSRLHTSTLQTHRDADAVCFAFGTKGLVRARLMHDRGCCVSCGFLPERGVNVNPAGGEMDLQIWRCDCLKTFCVEIAEKEGT